jgi:hypothetical protein
MTVTPDTCKPLSTARLPPRKRAPVAAQVAADRELAAYVEDQKALKAALSSRLRCGCVASGDRVATGTASWIPAVALAAGIALGVVLAGSFGIGTDVRSQNGSLIAQGELAQALTSALPGEENAARSGVTRVGASFWSKNAVFCRTFASKPNAPNALAGIACREGGAWRIVGHFRSGARTMRVQAIALVLPASIRGVMENLIVGEPLSGDAERQARGQGWRRALKTYRPYTVHSNFSAAIARNRPKFPGTLEIFWHVR